MKKTTEINDLRALLALRHAEAEEAAARQHAAALIRPASRRLSPDALLAAAVAIPPAADAADTARAPWMRRPLSRRQRAEDVRRFAETCADYALRFGGDYSGETSRRTVWGDAPAAVTATKEGGAYSRACTFRRTDAVHTVTLDPEGAPLLYEHRHNLVPASARDRLPLLALYALTKRTPGVFHAVWATVSNKRLRTQAGWVAYCPTTDATYHSTYSAEDAQRGLDRKRAACLREMRERRLHRKEERRAALVARLCRSVTATIADARALGFCEPGIRAFQARHGIADAAPLPDLIRTGDPAAVRLALSLARRVRRDATAAA